jgi:hypothetical protein
MRLTFYLFIHLLFFYYILYVCTIHNKHEKKNLRWTLSTFPSLRIKLLQHILQFKTETFNKLYLNLKLAIQGRSLSLWDIKMLKPASAFPLQYLIINYIPKSAHSAIVPFILVCLSVAQELHWPGLDTFEKGKWVRNICMLFVIMWLVGPAAIVTHKPCNSLKLFLGVGTNLLIRAQNQWNWAL